MSDSLKLNKGLISSLFDFKLEHLVSLKILKFVYFVFTVTVSLIAGFALIACLLSLQDRFYFIPLILLGYLVALIAIRIWIELISSLLQISRNTQELVQLSRHVAKNG